MTIETYRSNTDILNDDPRRRLSQLTGILFLLTFIVPMLNWALVNSRWVDPRDAGTTVRHVLADGGMFRFGLVGDLVSGILALALGLCLYTLMHSMNKLWARFALGLKAVEVTLLSVIVLGNFAVYLVINDARFVSSTWAVQLNEVAGTFFSTRMHLDAVPMLFLGLSMTIFMSLLYKSEYVPRALAGFGIVSSLMVLVFALLIHLQPETATNSTMHAIFWFPAGLFQIVIGIWLLTKGMVIPRTVSHEGSLVR